MDNRKETAARDSEHKLNDKRLSITSYGRNQKSSWAKSWRIDSDCVAAWIQTKVHRLGLAKILNVMTLRLEFLFLAGALHLRAPALQTHFD
jgi:hypothetical protein